MTIFYINKSYFMTLVKKINIKEVRADLNIEKPVCRRVFGNF